MSCQANPNLTIPTEEKPQSTQEMSLDSETIPLANESIDPVLESRTQKMSLDSETNPPANEAMDPVSELGTQESPNIELEGSGQTVRKSSRLQDIPQKHWDFKQHGKDFVLFAKAEKRFLGLNAETLPTSTSMKAVLMEKPMEPKNCQIGASVCPRN
jgi:hypothetical protein